MTLDCFVDDSSQYSGWKEDNSLYISYKFFFMYGMYGTRDTKSISYIGELDSRYSVREARTLPYWDSFASCTLILPYSIFDNIAFQASKYPKILLFMHPSWLSPKTSCSSMFWLPMNCCCSSLSWSITGGALSINSMRFFDTFLKVTSAFFLYASYFSSSSIPGWAWS